VYSNLAELLDVSKDQAVKKGQKIGTVGTTTIYEVDTIAASSNEPLLSHLHFEVLKKGTGNTYSKVDPKQYLSMQTHCQLLSKRKSTKQMALKISYNTIRYLANTF
jgi:murein DD-endopeptidase MepM/ murein hydrolase activator NlpD